MVSCLKITRACGLACMLAIAAYSSPAMSAEDAVPQGEELEQAALDSLRAICGAEVLELPGPPAPEAVIETVTEVAAGSGGGQATTTVDSASAEFEAEYAETVA